MKGKGREGGRETSAFAIANQTFFTASKCGAEIDFGGGKKEGKGGRTILMSLLDNMGHRDQFRGLIGIRKMYPKQGRVILRILRAGMQRFVFQTFLNYQNSSKNQSLKSTIVINFVESRPWIVSNLKAFITMTITASICTDHNNAPDAGGLYLAKPYPAKSESVVQESGKPYFAKPGNC